MSLHQNLFDNADAYAVLPSIHFNKGTNVIKESDDDLIPIRDSNEFAS